MKMLNPQPSREVGILKNLLRDAILDGEISNDYNAAYTFLNEKHIELLNEISK